MTLHDTIASDANDVFLNSDEFAESVTYYPRSGGSRAITAIVERLQETAYDVQSNLPLFNVRVANDATTGISSAELDMGGDQISLPIADGKTATRRTITDVIEQDHGMLTLEVR